VAAGGSVVLARALAALHLGLPPRTRRRPLGSLLLWCGKVLLLRDDQPQQFVAAQRREVLRDRQSVNCKPLRQRLQAEPLINYLRPDRPGYAPY